MERSLSLRPKSTNLVYYIMQALFDFLYSIFLDAPVDEFTQYFIEKQPVDDYVYMQAKLQSQVQAKLQPQVQPKLQPQVQPKVQAKLQPKVQLKLQPKVQLNLQPLTIPVSNPKYNLRPRKPISYKV